MELFYIRRIGDGELTKRYDVLFGIGMREAWKRVRGNRKERSTMWPVVWPVSDVEFCGQVDPPRGRVGIGMVWVARFKGGIGKDRRWDVIGAAWYGPRDSVPWGNDIYYGDTMEMNEEEAREVWEFLENYLDKEDSGVVENQ